MRPALVPILLADPLPWARKADYAWDFLRDRARFAGGYKGALANTPGWSFTRASSGYALNAAGLLIEFASGEIRRTDKGVLIEGSKTNRALWCRDLTDAVWTKSNTTAAKTETGADGAANSASRITATANNGTALQAITNASVARTISAYVKRVTGSGAVYITADGDATRTDITSLINASSYSLVRFDQTLANPNVGFKLATSGDAIAVDFVQCEDNAGWLGASSPILTTNAQVTRAADSLVLAGSTSFSAPLTMFVEVAIDANIGQGQVLVGVDDTTLNERITLTHNNSTGLRIQVVTGGATQANDAAGLMTPGVVSKFAGAAATNNVRSVKDGGTPTSDTTATMPTGLSRAALMTTSGTTFGYIRRVAIFNRALTDAELQAITAT
jgi:hypothetical protein